MEQIYDIAIIGAGPAGLTAAIYALRDNKNVILIERDIEGGQIINTSSVSNIPGHSSVSGADFIRKMMDQISSLLSADNSFCLKYETVVDISKERNFTIITENATYVAKTVICATGSSYRTLDVEGEKALIGNGISFCSTCDAPFYKNKKVAVIGGGNSALTEAIELAKFAAEIEVYQNLSFFTANAALQNMVEANPKIFSHFSAEVSSFEKVDDKIKINLNNNDSVCVDGVFIAIGLVPHNEYAKHIGLLDKWGYIVSLVDGAYAAGDCKRMTANQVAIACGSGAEAAIEACRYLDF